jgi:hypothetical protein
MSEQQAATTMVDPRRGVPSASGLARLEQCPGSWRMSQGYPDIADPDAESGTRIHRALETNDYSALSLAEREQAERCANQAEGVFDAWGKTGTEAREVRLGMTKLGGVVAVTPETTAKLVFTGQADVSIFSETSTSALVMDYKTGRGDYDPAEDNAQLRGLAVLAAKYHRVEQVRVALIQPWSGKPTVADYDKEALEAATESVKLALADAARPDAPLWAGDHCQYCPAKADCSALRELAESTAAKWADRLPAEPVEARAKLYGRAQYASATQLRDLLKVLRVLRWLDDAVVAAAKERAKSDPEFQQFYRLKPAAAKRTITDPQQAWQWAATKGVSNEGFLKAVTVKLGELATAVSLASPPKRKNDGTPHATQREVSLDRANKMLNELMVGGAMTVSESEPQLEEVEA